MYTCSLCVCIYTCFSACLLFVVYTVHRRYKVAQLLGCHGAAVNIRGKSGSTAFDIANMLGMYL